MKKLILFLTLISITTSRELNAFFWDDDDYYQNVSCKDLREDFVETFGGEIIKIYEPKLLSRGKSRVKCVGEALLDDGYEYSIIYSAYIDREGEWMLEWGER